MTINRLLDKSASGPDEIRSMAEAYESTLRVLGLIDRNDSVTELVAKKIMEIAQTGERNAQRLSALAIERLGVPVTMPSHSRLES